MLSSLRLLAGIALGGAVSLIPAATAQPLNLSRAKAAVVEYHDSGAYAADLQEVADEAIAWLRERVEANLTGERLAMVFDIDETVLSNYPHMAEQDFGYVPSVWVEWVEKADAPPIEPIRAVYREARELGVAVIFLTGRSAPEESVGTKENLHATGMGDYERLILRSDEDTAPTAAERKAKRRAALEQEGWTIIASIGDQASDLAGGYTERTFKLPNPFYEIL
jgi:acid phosphatase